MSISIKQLIPAIAVHPGEILIDELKERGISQNDFSQLTGIPLTQLNEIIKGKRNINADIAMVIGKALGMDAVLWMNMQTNYDLDLTKIKERTRNQLEAMDKWDMIRDYIPVAFFKKQKFITGNPVHDIPALYEIYGVNNSDQLISVYSQNNYARFRKSEKLSVDKINLIGWVKLVSFEANKIKVGPFDFRNQHALLTELKEVFKNNLNTVGLTRSVLARYGIKFVIQAHPDQCAVDGVSFWSNGNPAIGMSIRHKRIDNFAFTVLHELGHIFLHLVNNNNAESIDLEKEENNTDYSHSKEEKEANAFSSETMLDSKSWATFIATNSIHNQKKVLEFAEKTGTHPGVIYGRYSKETGNYKIKASIDKTLS